MLNNLMSVEKEKFTQDVYIGSLLTKSYVIKPRLQNTHQK